MLRERRDGERSILEDGDWFPRAGGRGDRLQKEERLAMSDDGKKDAPEEGAGPFDLSAMKDMLSGGGNSMVGGRLYCRCARV